MVTGREKPVEAASRVTFKFSPFLRGRQLVIGILVVWFGMSGSRAMTHTDTAGFIGTLPVRLDGSSLKE